MTVVDTSMEAFENIKAHLEPSQSQVLVAIDELGPTHDRRILEYLNQREMQKPRRFRKKWEINQVTARRNRLVQLDVVVDMGPYSGLWNGRNKTYHFWRARGEFREPTGWVKTEIEPHVVTVPQMVRQAHHPEQTCGEFAESSRRIEKPAIFREQMALGF